jgi:hypothetical protein
MITIKKKIHFTRGGAGRRQIVPEPAPSSTVPAGRVPRISKLMALAIKFDGLLREGRVTDQSELARLSHITQPRMTQIMNLLHLAPDIQEELLFLPRVTQRQVPIHEKMLRPITAKLCWQDQRAAWGIIRTKAL